MLKLFAENAGKTAEGYVKAIASNSGFWGEDLTEYRGFVNAAADYLSRIESDPRSAAEYITEN